MRRLDQEGIEPFTKEPRLGQGKGVRSCDTSLMVFEKAQPDRDRRGMKARLLGASIICDCPWMIIRFSILLIAAVVAFPFLGRSDDLPNIVLLMGDDHGWHETGYNGHPFLKTPVLDEMAAAGIRLDRFYAAHPSCSPTRGSFLTGRHPNRYGTFAPGWSIRPEEITIAHQLSEAGYECGHFGKWHLGPVKSDSPTNPGRMGFQHYISHDNFYEMDPPFSDNGAAPEVYPGEGSEVTIDETIKFIETSREKKKPFLAVVWFGSPHEPYSGLEVDLALYNDLPEEWADREVRLTSMETGMPTKRPLRDVMQERYAEITAMDRAIGNLRDALSEKGIRENTLLWYCGDNGAPSSAGRATAVLRAEKGKMYEGGIRVPGVIEWPAGIKSPFSSDVNSVTSDLLPTLCDLAEVSLPNRPLDGISLLPLIQGKMKHRSKPIFFWSYPTNRLSGREATPEPYIQPELQEGTTPLVKFMGGKPTRSFRNYTHPEIGKPDYEGARVMLGDRYKLVIDGSKGSGAELFDMNSDPEEQSNLAKEKTEITSEMKSTLKEWQDSVLNSLLEADY